MSKKNTPTTHLLDTDGDDLIARDSGEWAERKLQFVASYIQRFIVSMRNKKWRAINYIDLFSGPGKNRIHDTNRFFLGSPLIALGQAKQFDRYFFADAKPEHIKALKQRCPEKLLDRIEFWVGNANELVDRVVNHISGQDKRHIHDKWSSLNLAFLDPEGLELEWATVEKLAKLRTDIIIYYPQMAIEREIDKEYTQTYETPIDKFIGDRQWREIYQPGGSGKHRKLLDYYKSKLSSFGYVVDDPVPEPDFRNSKNAILYRLLFISKHPLGNKFWEDVVNNPADGSRKLF